MPAARHARTPGFAVAARIRMRGVTLVELALAIFILGLILGGILLPLSAQVEQRQTEETRRQLEEIREALVGFAVVNGHLPCPDQSSGAGANDGVEDTSSGSCSVILGTSPNFFAMGNLPWVTLGLGDRDLWNNRYRYAVLRDFSRRTPATPPTLGTTDDLRVCDSATCTTTLSTTAVAVILSHGSNGYGAVSSLSGSTNPASASADEIENTDGDRDFVYRPRYSGGLAASEFDDIVVWLSRYTLFNRMVAAGKLP